MHSGSHPVSGAETQIDLNADLGEGVTDDDGLLEVVTSANLACGFHARRTRGAGRGGVRRAAMGLMREAPG